MAAKKPPDQVRRRNSSNISQLPIDGRKGPPPKWPLESQSPMERKRWKEIWVKPMAVIWEAWQLHDVVARYIRMAVAGEEPDSPVTLLSEIRQMEVQLGLTPLAIFRLQWTLGEARVTSAVSAMDAYQEAVGE